MNERFGSSEGGKIDTQQQTAVMSLTIVVVDGVLTKSDLVAMCRQLGVKGYSRLNKPELYGLLTAQLVERQSLTKDDLVCLCRELGVKGYSHLNKPELCKLLLPPLMRLDKGVLSQLLTPQERQELAVEAVKKAGEDQLEILRRAQQEMAAAVAEQVQAVQELQAATSLMTKKTKVELVLLCKQYGIKKYSTLRKNELVSLLQANGVAV